MASTHSNRTKGKVNVAVVGLGFMGVTHLKAYRHVEAARVLAVCDARNLPVNGRVHGGNGNLNGSGGVVLGRGVKVYACLEEVLADPEVDLIDLCVPTPLHHPHALAALAAGKHVLCEKPMARNSRQAEEMVKAARKAKRYFMPAMCMRFWPEWAWLKEAVDNRTYGRVLAARFRRVGEPPAWSRADYFQGAQSGGALLDLHIHDTDFVQYLFGAPLSVYSTGLSRFSGAIDYVVTQYRVASGAVVHAEGGWLMSGGCGFTMAYTVNFEKATADYDLGRGPDALRLYQDGEAPRTVRCQGVDGYVRELAYLTERILHGKPPVIVTAEDGLNAVKLCEAEERSIAAGRPIAMPVAKLPMKVGRRPFNRRDAMNTAQRSRNQMSNPIETQRWRARRESQSSF